MRAGTDDERGSLTALCVLTKPPWAGLAKTRLLPAIPPAVAAELARAFIRDTWQLARGVPWARPALVVTEGAEELRQLTGADRVWLQGPGDLGERMERALRRGLALAPRALVIGTDCPALPRRLLDEAHHALLAGAPAVLGPAIDGGFYLLGVTSCSPGLLAGLRWSHGEVLDATRRRLGDRGLDPVLGGPCFDVDRPADLLHLARELDAGRMRAPETELLLERPDLREALRCIVADEVRLRRALPRQ